MKVNKHIEIVRSTIRALSSMSQESCDAILAVLTRNYTNVGVTVVNNISDLETLVDNRPDLVFLGMKFVTADVPINAQSPSKIWLTEYLDEHGIAYTGSGQIAHELELDKPSAKQRVLDAGLKTSPFYVITQGQRLAKHAVPLAYPLFVKPTNRGGGLGIDSNSVVSNFDELQSKVESITVNLHSDSLVEEYLPGREFSVAILKDEHSEELMIMPIELVAPPDEHGKRLLSQQVKSSDSERVVEVTDKVTRAIVSTLATDVFYALGARDYGRIDIRLDKFGTPHFLEANLIPSLISNYGSFPRACVLNASLDYEIMILSIVRLALVRSLNLSDFAPAQDTVGNILLPSHEAALEVL